MTPLLLLLSYIGFKKWYVRANLLESSYLAYHAGFLLIHSVFHYGAKSSSSLLPHYWLPLLPFVFSILAGNFSNNIFFKHKKHSSRPLTTCLIIFILLTGFIRLLSFNNHEYRSYWKEKQHMASQLKNFIKKNTTKDTPIMTMDIGFSPYYFDRPTITMINSPENALSQIQTYNPAYMVAFFSTQMGIMPYVNEMANSYKNHDLYKTIQTLKKNHPNLLVEVFHSNSNHQANFAKIFHINSF